MAYFPGQQAFRQPYPRKRTKQGGNGRAVSESGVPNAMARGFQVPGRGPGNRLQDTPPPNGNKVPTGQPGSTPPPGSQSTPPLKAGTPGRFTPGGKYDTDTPRRWLENLVPRPRDNRVDGSPNSAARSAMFGGPDDGRPNMGAGDIFGGPDDGRPNSGAERPGPAMNPNMIRPGGPHGGSGRNPQDHLRFWENWGWKWNGSKFVPVPPQGGGPGGGGPAVGPGGGGPGGPGNPGGHGGRGGDDPAPPPFGGPGDPGDPNFDAGPDPYTQDMIANLRKQIGLPLDPQFEAARRMLRDQLMAQLTGQQAQYGVGMAGINNAGVQGNMAIDEDMAARGLFGSGIENREERVLGDDLALQQSGLLGEFTTGQQGAQMDFRRGMIEALLDLARRSSRDPRSPALRG